jgi:hypothetical protein
MGNNARYVQEVGQQSDQPCVACEPSKSDQSKFDHICPNNPILTCNCSDPNACAELGNDPDNAHGNKVCPDSGKVCNTAVCPNECLGDKDGFSDNLDYTGIPYPKGKATVSGWPCVVVGAVCEAWTTTAEHVLRTTAGEWDTKRNTDAGFNNDGPATTKGL